MNDRRARLLNLVLLQVAVVGPLLVAARSPLTAGLMGWVACALQLVVLRGGATAVRAMFVGGVAGTLVEGGAAWLGAITFLSTPQLAGLPLWLAPSWAMFAVSLHYVLAPLQGRFVLATVVGTVATAGSLYAATLAGQIAVTGPISFAATVVALGLTIGLMAQRLAPSESSGQ